MTAPSRRAAAVLTIDWSRCDGHGLCAALLPNGISRDDWGYPILDQARLAGSSEAELNRAVACCPALALRRRP
jgi:ferredoxin